MPKAEGNTDKGKLTFWLRKNPGTYCVKNLARQHKMSVAVVRNTLLELEANNQAARRRIGRTDKWLISE